MEHAIVTEQLGKRFKQVDAVRDLSLRMPAGSILGFIGPNGAGKTTTLKMLMNLIAPDAGRATLLGVDSRRLDPATLARIGYVSENQKLPDWMTVRQLLAYCRPFYPTWDAALCARLLDLLDLPEDRAIKHLSRGMRTKAALVSSLAYRPELLIMDEPFSGLDPLMRDDVVRAVLELATERPLSVLISSHDLQEIEPLIDWVAYLRDGRLLFAESVASLQARVRQVEIVTDDPASDAAPHAAAPPEWINVETSGRTLRFVVPRYREGDTERDLAARFAGARIQATPLSLRETFITLARHDRREARRAAAETTGTTRQTASMHEARS